MFVLIVILLICWFMLGDTTDAKVVMGANESAHKVVWIDDEKLYKLEDMIS
jgi:hypothetical protein